MLGNAACVWRDAVAALDLFEPDIIAACNDVGSQWPGRLDIWATLHAEKMGKWQEARRLAGLPDASVSITHLHADRDLPGTFDRFHEIRWPGMTASGSSGMFALKCAMDAGATRCVLAGIPISANSMHIAHVGPWVDAGAYTNAWEHMAPRLAQSVRSMSGWTRKRLGAPDRDWLSQGG